MEDNKTHVETTTTSIPEVTNQTDNQQIDYKAELEKTKKRLEKAEYTLYKKSKEERARKHEPESKVFSDTEETPVEEETVDEKIAKAIGQVQMQSVSQVLDTLTSNPDEKELALYNYEHVISKTGNIELDTENALVLANKERILKENRELKAALLSKKSMTSNSLGGSSKPDIEKPSTYFGEAQIADLKKKGWSDEKIKRAEEIARNRS